jgi:eukaryotic-like serine/threonine-protein kinase
MAELGDDGAAQPSGVQIGPPGAGARLKSWKEIAEYIGRDVRTAHRWESNNGLPVHRLMHDKGATVYALTTEIDEWMAKRTAGPPEPPGPPVQPDRTRRVLWITAGVLLVAAAAVGVWFSLPKRQSGSQLRLPTPLTADAGWAWGPQLSPDGRSMAYTRGDQNLGPQVVVQLIGGGQPVPIAGPERNTYSPTWSSDGKSIALLRQHPEQPAMPADLIVLPAFGGAERKIAKVFSPPPFHNYLPDPYIDWSSDDRFLAISESLAKSTTQHRISIVSVASGEKRVLTEGVERIFGDYSPRFSPDGHRIAFSRVSEYGISDVFVLDLTAEMRPAGSPRRIPSEDLWNANPVWTSDSQRLLFVSGTLRNTRLSIVDANGKSPPEMLPVLDSGIGPFDIASMGKNQVRLVYTRLQLDSDIWKIPLTHFPVHPAEMAKVVPSSYLDRYPRFSPDGTKFAFVSNRTGNDEIWVAIPNGSQPLQLTKLKGGGIGRPAWSPDGLRIAVALHSVGTIGIYEIGVADGRVQQLVPGGADEAFPDYSLDGKWLYFSSRRSGAQRIWRVPASGGNPVLVSDYEAQSPLFLPAGNGVVYLGQNGAVRFQPLAGGQPLQIFDEVYSAEHVDVTQAGVYGVIPRDKGRRQTLVFYSFANRQLQELFEYPHPPTGGLSISPDGKYALVTMKEHFTIDLMMVDGLEIRPF